MKRAKALTDSEREYYIQGQLDLAAEPRRILRYEFLCVMTGSFVMTLPFLLHALFPALVPSAFAETPDPAVLWIPVIALAVVAAAFLYMSRRSATESGDRNVFPAMARVAPLFVSAASIVMIMTGTSDLQRQFALGRHLAAFIDSRGHDSHTSPAVVEWSLLAMVAIAAMVGLQTLHARVVIQPSWLYQHAMRERTAAMNRQVHAVPGTGAADNGEIMQVGLSEAVIEARVALYRVRLMAGFMYAAITSSACLYFAFGRQRYLHDPVAASFGILAYVLNLILAGEGFRVRLVNMRSMRRAGTAEAEVMFDSSVRVLKFSLGNAAVALVYVWLLSHGGLDKGADLLMKVIIPGWSRLQAFILSNVLTLIALGVLINMITNRIERMLSARRRRKRMRALAVRNEAAL